MRRKTLGMKIFTVFQLCVSDAACNQLPLTDAQSAGDFLQLQQRGGGGGGGAPSGGFYAGFLQIYGG